MDRPPTLRHVAARAGCSAATVSRVLTGNGPVSPTMSARVLEAAAELGFPLAATVRRPVLGVLLPSLTNPVFAAVLAGVEQAARGRGLSVIMGQSSYDAVQEVAVVSALLAENPTGLVMTVCDPSTSEALARVTRERWPAATVYNEDVPASVGAVAIDNRSAVRQLTETLIGLGHRSILFVGGRFASSDRAAGRYRGYCDAVAAAGLPRHPPLEVDYVDAAQDVELTDAFATCNPTALVVSNDLLAVTVIASLRRMGLRVPEDVSVTGFDGIDIARHVAPPLTTVIQPSRTMGVLAASMVLDIATARGRPSHIRSAFTVARGGTVAPAPGAPRPPSPLRTGAPHP